jgi:hypothetical protein
MTDRIPVYSLPGNAEPIDHVWTEIGKGIAEYRGYFVSKTSSGRDWLVLEPAPSRNVFGVFPTIWDAEEAIDAFCDRGVEPSEDGEPTSPSTEHLWATTSKVV